MNDKVEWNGVCLKDLVRQKKSTHEGQMSTSKTWINTNIVKANRRRVPKVGTSSCEEGKRSASKTMHKNIKNNEAERNKSIKCTRSPLWLIIDRLAQDNVGSISIAY